MVTMAAWGFDISTTNSLQSLDAFNARFYFYTHDMNYK
jgi:hypothetical protein